MDRYIKESELIEVIDKWQDTLSPRTDIRDSVIFNTLESVNFHIDNLATADVVEVVHGYWEAYPTRHYKRCSVCKTEYYKLYNGFKGNYCPNCGAKMDGKKVE